MFDVELDAAAGVDQTCRECALRVARRPRSRPPSCTPPTPVHGAARVRILWFVNCKARNPRSPRHAIYARIGTGCSASGATVYSRTNFRSRPRVPARFFVTAVVENCVRGTLPSPSSSERWKEVDAAMTNARRLYPRPR